MGERQSWRCKNCLWGDGCSDKGACSHYTPLKDLDDKEVARLVKEGEREYLKAWETYLREFQDPR